jgi:hypothetical protein
MLLKRVKFSIFFTSIQTCNQFLIDFIKVPAFKHTRRSTFGNVKKRSVENKEMTHVRCYQQIRTGRKIDLIYHVTFKNQSFAKFVQFIEKGTTVLVQNHRVG